MDGVVGSKSATTAMLGRVPYRSVHDRAAGEVDLARGDGAGPVGRGEDGDVGNLVVAGQMPEQQARRAGCARGAGCVRGSSRAGAGLTGASLAGDRGVPQLVVFVVSG